MTEKGKKILVRMPQKHVFEAIKDLEDTDEDNPTIEDTESIYRLLAAVLSNNMGKVPVTAEDVEDYDIEECTAILEAYMEFVDELKANPNSKCPFIHARIKGTRYHIHFLHGRKNW